MAARRRELGELRAELAVAREMLHEERWRAGRNHYWTTTIRMIEGEIARASVGVEPVTGLRPRALPSVRSKPEGRPSFEGAVGVTRRASGPSTGHDLPGGRTAGPYS
jgi:hypothetical protein